MKKEKIIQIVEIENPITFNPFKITFNDKTFKFGFFEIFMDKEELKEKHLWRIIENNNTIEYKKAAEKDVIDKTNNAIKYSTIIKGDDIISINF